jgi:hypothetical protein
VNRVKALEVAGAAGGAASDLFASDAAVASAFGAAFV